MDTSSHGFTCQRNDIDYELNINHELIAQRNANLFLKSTKIRHRQNKLFQFRDGQPTEFVHSINTHTGVIFLVYINPHKN